MTSLMIQLRISFLFYVGLSHNLVKEIWVVDMTLRSYKISCEIEGHVDLRGQLQGKYILFLYHLVCQFITPSILDRVPASFQQSLLKKGTSGFWGITPSIYLIRDWILLVCFSWRYEATEVPRVNFVMREEILKICEVGFKHCTVHRYSIATMLHVIASCMHNNFI